MLTIVNALPERTAELTRALINPVLLEQNPLEVVDRVLVNVVYAHVLDGTLDEYREALDQALASNVRLATLLSEYHPEPIVRRFLTEVRRRLVLN